MTEALILINVLIAGVLYMLPTIVAMARHHHQAGLIATLNVTLGWTIIAWCVALGWSFTHPVRMVGRPPDQE